MVTLTKYGAKYNRNILFLEGLSTDTKPTDEFDGLSIQNGSEYTEVDTGKKFLFDYDNATWYEVQTGGGGGTSGGIVLVGTTTTQLTDGATTNPITVDGQSYTAKPNDAVIYGNKEFLFDGTNWHEFGDLSGLASKDIGAMTGYEKPNATSAIGTSDTLNQAVGKLEKALDLKQSTIDSDHKLSADNVDDTSTTNKFATAAQLSQIETNKNNISKNAAELVELVDNGAKSLVNFPSINPIAVRSSYTTITDGYTITGNASAAYSYMALPFTNFKAGNYVLKITVSAFTGADAAIFVKKGNYSIGTNIASQMVTQTGDISIPFTLDTDSAEMGITIYPNQAATEAQQSISVSKLMICSKAAWDISQNYVRYAPTNAELYEMIKALQS